ncbi:MAG TPA: peptidoglycan editing factor PgeF [Steroidobacteraceae bacterium]|nr:peptidoglycan editing factor PgeF [Steroidobacteraceae bacterium]
MSESLLEMHWDLPPGVRAACTTRLGGVSESPWDSFNLATHVGDDPAHVAANRARLRQLLALEREPAWLNQVHGVEVAELDSPPIDSKPMTADASVTSKWGVACVVMVADCLPVLLTARDGSRVGAAHAGWRGLCTGVIERTAAAMGVPGSELRAWLGPCISRAHFEVGEEVREEFVRQDGDAADCFEQNARGRWQADLVALAKRRLQRLGLRDVSGGHWCTFADSPRSYSHRRDGRSGRLAALIWRAPP